MSWVRIDDNAFFHQKHIKAGPLASWLWVAGLGYGTRLRTDLIPFGAVGSLTASIKPRLAIKLAETLVEVNLWERTRQGYRIHDFHDFHETPSERQQKQEKRKVANSRYYQRIKTSPKTSLKTELRPSDEKSQDREPTPVPVPVPPYPPRGDARLKIGNFQPRRSARRSLADLRDEAQVRETQAVIQLMAQGLSLNDASRKVREP